MPIIKSAKKKVRKDKKRAVHNAKVLSFFKETLKKIKKGGRGVPELIKKYYSQIDKAVKKNVIHKNKAKRLKSTAGKLLAKK
ncbi:MAG: 30S ribosomal protein S20 [Candidatus Roizmanbacteria bacterium GW2011_GWA2_35_8]|uniref:Small ribosomal subunit protein bS20 n=1 Tax=Candidatus Roizmanbacteria bacterium GW2011_GWA2_35_8 TaxID=1618479 RepID=A0A0G0CZV7_9BACT|nr:MAG: 30S ribosomal protein S20 [Candidatus Roizmanbacteria bacterium GW2011_GWA2_35_8]